MLNFIKVLWWRLTLLNMMLGLFSLSAMWGVWFFMLREGIKSANPLLILPALVLIFNIGYIGFGGVAKSQTGLDNRKYQR